LPQGYPQAKVEKNVLDPPFLDEFIKKVHKEGELRYEQHNQTKN